MKYILNLNISYFLAHFRSFLPPGSVRVRIHLTDLCTVWVSRNTFCSFSSYHQIDGGQLQLAVEPAQEDGPEAKEFCHCSLGRWREHAPDTSIVKNRYKTII